MIGGGGKISSEQPRLAGVELQSSAYGLGIPIVLGTTRLTGNLIWYSDFRAIGHTQSQGGKGGPTYENTTYTYEATFAFGICEGPIADIGKIWVGKEQHTLANLGLTLFTGSASQATWGWMDTNHPAESLNHRRLAYVARAGYPLGNNASINNHSFEVVGPLRLVDGITTLPDCDPADMITDVLTNSVYSSCGWILSRVGSLTQFSNACRAYGILLSAALKEQRSTGEILTEIVKTANAQCFFSEGKLKIVPYADQAATGHGATYTPYLTAEYELNDDHFIVDSNSGDPPVRCVRRSPADAYNQVTVEFLNRANDYNTETVEAKDQANIEIFGSRPMDKLTLHMIQDAEVARVVADQILRRSLYVRNEYHFRLDWRFVRLEPMDIVKITDPGLGLNKAAVRITSIEETDSGDFDIVAEEFLGEVNTAAVYGSQAGSGYTPNYNVAPGDVNTPVVFEPPISLAKEAAVWVAVSGGVNWGGCDIWISYDGTTYKALQRVMSPARMGQLTATLPAGSDPDSVNTLAVDLSVSRSQIFGGTTGDADAMRTLCYLSTGELLSYRDATLTGSYTYDLDYLRRGAYNTTVVSSPSGTKFVRIDESIVKIPYSPNQVGDAIYLKFTSFNAFGVAQQSLADVSAVTYTITGLAIRTVSNLALAQPFTNSYCSIKWDQVDEAIGYQVVVKSGVTTLRTVKTTDTNYTYSFEDGTADGGPYRSLTFEVSAIGTTLAGGIATLSATNAVPAVPTVSYTPGPQNVIVVAAPSSSDTDIAGMRIWASTSSGFTPGPSNLAYDSDSLQGVIVGSGGVPLYFRVALFDRFGNTGLNMTTEVSATPSSLAADSIPVVSSLPAAGVVGRVLYLSTDNKMYRDTGTAWVTWVDGSDLLAASVTAGKMSVTQLSAIAANIGAITAGSFTLDNAGWVKTSGVASFGSGTGIWIGYDSTAYKFRVGNPAGQYLSWDGSALTFTGALSGATGTFSGSLSAATGSFGAISATGTITVSTTGSIGGGQTAYNTGTGFFLGYSSGAYKFSIGNPAASYVTWDGTTLTIQGNIVDKRTFTAGTTLVAAASAEVFMPGAALAYAKTKAITVPRGGTLRCTWDIYAGTTGSNTKSRVYKNGVALSSEFIDTSIGWATHTYDATVAAGDSIEIWTYWNSTQGKCRNFTLGNNFNENFFVVSLD